jgi:UDP-N-acetylglucosamine 2-epimerase (non-hydrolysing)
VRKKAFVLRESTERPEAVLAGYVEVVGTRAAPVVARIEQFLAEPWNPSAESPYGDGTAGQRIAEISLGRA